MAGIIFRNRGKHKIQGFLNLVLHPFDIDFPLEFRHRKKPLRNGWITQGIKMSCKK